MGFLFTDLMNMLENRYGIVRTQKIVDDARLENKGAFTAVGYYKRSDLERMLRSMIAELGGTEKEWLYELGMYMAESHIRRNPELYVEVRSVYDFLLRVNSIAQARVSMLYPNVELPTYEARIIGDNTLELLYSSPNRLGDLTVGWVSGKARQFGEKIEISQFPLSEDGSKIRFIIKRI